MPGDEETQKEHEDQLDNLQEEADSHTKELKKGQQEFHFIKKEINIIKRDVNDIKTGLQERGLINNVHDKRLDMLEIDVREGDKDAKEDLRSFREEMSVTRNSVIGLATKMSDLSAAVATVTTLFQQDTKKETDDKTDKRLLASRRLTLIMFAVGTLIAISGYLSGVFSTVLHLLGYG
jgi:chromosome segregation ATPase